MLFPNRTTGAPTGAIRTEAVKLRQRGNGLWTAYFWGNTAEIRRRGPSDYDAKVNGVLIPFRGLRPAKEYVREALLRLVEDFAAEK